MIGGFSLSTIVALLLRFYEYLVFAYVVLSWFPFREGFFLDAYRVHQVDARLVSTLWHEYTHSALASLAPPGTFPAWLNEGLAELFEREALGRSGGPTADEIVALRTAAGSGQWLSLAELSGPTFAGLDPPPGSAGMTLCAR